MPKPAEQLDGALSTQLTRAEKQALDLLAAWQFSTPEQLAELMGGVTRRRANQALRSLRRRFLVQREPDGFVLSDEGLTYLARRDRAAVGPTLDRWTPQQSEGVYFGTALRALASQLDHQRGITEFAARLSAEVAHDPGFELLDLLPTQRSQITYWHSGGHYVLHPDASFQLNHQGDWDWCLVEVERRAVTPKRVPERLRGYRRYFASDQAERDHGGLLPLVLFLFETAEAERTFLDHAAAPPHPRLTTVQPGTAVPRWICSLHRTGMSRVCPTSHLCQHACARPGTVVAKPVRRRGSVVLSLPLLQSARDAVGVAASSRIRVRCFEHRTAALPVAAVRQGQLQ